jgi:hypothetical protein
MDAQDWQAAAEVLGVLLVVLNMLGGLFIYRMQANFVTRAEHSADQKHVGGRLDEAEDKIGQIDKQIAGLFTNEKAQLLYEKMSAVQAQSAALLGQMPALERAISALSHQTNLLIESGLRQSKGAGK